MFCDRFFVGLKVLCLWSCIVRNKFGYGRVPTTSTHVELEFNKPKNLLLPSELLKMRLGVFIDFHVKHLNSKTIQCSDE